MCATSVEYVLSVKYLPRYLCKQIIYLFPERNRTEDWISPDISFSDAYVRNPPLSQTNIDCFWPWPCCWMSTIVIIHSGIGSQFSVSMDYLACHWHMESVCCGLQHAKHLEVTIINPVESQPAETANIIGGNQIKSQPNIHFFTAQQSYNHRHYKGDEGNSNTEIRLNYTVAAFYNYTTIYRCPGSVRLVCHITTNSWTNINNIWL